MDTFYNIVNKNHFCIDFSIVKNQIFVKLKYSEKSDVFAYVREHSMHFETAQFS